MHLYGEDLLAVEDRDMRGDLTFFVVCDLNVHTDVLFLLILQLK